MDDAHEQKVREVCRRLKLGVIEFHSDRDDEISVYSLIPVLSVVSIAFPKSVIVDYGEEPFEDNQPTYWVRLKPFG